jgi:hypothetical protein
MRRKYGVSGYGYGDEGDGARTPFYKPARRLMALSRRYVLGFWHIGRPKKGSAGEIDVPVPYSKGNLSVFWRLF